jgi:hypothetical protein
MTRRLAIAAVLATAVVAGLTAPTASADIKVGLGDQNAIAFNDPLFKALKFKRTRIVVPWNVALKRRNRVYLDDWLRAARAARLEPLVAFATAEGSRCPRRRCRAPSVKQYTRAFAAFRRRWRFVRVVNPWNEANHRSQPTFRKPKQAARYYNVVRKRCRGCKIVAADVIDEANMVRWLKVFLRTAKKPRIWGLHNYRDTNPRKGQRYGGTRRLTRTVRGQIWLTETGGLVKFHLPNNRPLFRFNERRANSATKRVFRLARQNRRRIKRIYLYNWQGPGPRGRFDSGLIRPNGQPRPSYFTVQRTLRGRLFNP